MSLRFFVFVALEISASMGLSTFAAAGECDSIKIWTRKAGDYSGSAENLPDREVTIPLTSLKTKVRRLVDTQYTGEKSFKVQPLEDIIASYKRDGKLDLVLLHFQNKMVVPLSLDESESFKNKIFLATAISTDGKWTSEFPIVVRPDETLRDPRPIRFCGNKLVVTKPFSFRLAGQNMTPKPFTPWRHVDSLVSIEFAEKNAYYAQFDIGKSAQSAEGFQVFKNRCQFCHGVQRVGADLGWDYAGPIPAYEKRPAASLFLHVKYEKVDSFRLGTIMPPQSDIQEHEATVLWQWLKDVAKLKLHPYQPRT